MLLHIRHDLSVQAIAYLQADAVGEVHEVLPEDAHLSSQSRLATQVVFDKTLHNWNYVVSPYLSSHVIF